jgi:hypothetical protein
LSDHSVEECEESDGEPDRIDSQTPAEVEEFMARRFRRTRKKGGKRPARGQQ